MSSYRRRSENTAAFKDFLVELRGIEPLASAVHVVSVDAVSV
jgi:hypothetical protein